MSAKFGIESQYMKATCQMKVVKRISCLVAMVQSIIIFVALGKFQKDELRVFLGIIANVIRFQLNIMNKCVVSRGIAMKSSTHFQKIIKFDSLKYHGIICDQVHSMCFHPFKFHKRCYSFNVGTFNFSTTKTTFKILHMSNEIKFINHTHSLIHKWDSSVTLLRTI